MRKLATTLVVALAITSAKQAQAIELLVEVLDPAIAFTTIYTNQQVATARIVRLSEASYGLDSAILDAAITAEFAPPELAFEAELQVEILQQAQEQVDEALYHAENVVVAADVIEEVNAGDPAALEVVEFEMIELLYVAESESNLDQTLEKLEFLEDSELFCPAVQKVREILLSTAIQSEAQQQACFNCYDELVGMLLPALADGVSPIDAGHEEKKEGETTDPLGAIIPFE